MSKIGTFYSKEEMKTYDVEEGAVIITKGLSRPHGDPVETATFENQVDEENFLIPGTNERSIKLAAAGEIATHINMYDPEFSGKVPTESAAAGEYEPRFVAAAKLKSGEQLMPLASDNVEIKAGDKLEIKDPKLGLDKTLETTDVAISWDDVPANTGGYILAEVSGPIRVKASPVIPEPTTYAVSVTVTDGTDPVEGAVVTLIDRDDSTKIFTGTSGSAGGCTINAEAGTYIVIAEAETFADYTSSTNLVVDDDETLAVVLTT